MRKRVNLIIFLVGMVFFFTVSGKPMSAQIGNDCVCQTKNTGGVKTCEIEINVCPAGKNPTCQYNPDGACNHAFFQGASCVCLRPGEVNPTISDEGYEMFCVQKGFGPASANPKISTALGCVPVKVEKFAEWLLTYVFGIAGGIAFLLMVYGFILVSTTGGDPKKMQGAQETITSAITGLIVCIFAVFLLRLIAVNILRIPGIN